MCAIKTTSLMLAALVATMTTSLTTASADNATLSVRDTQGLPLYTSNIRDHGVDCVGVGCVNNPDGSIDHQKTYEATVRAQSQPKQ